MKFLVSDSLSTFFVCEQLGGTQPNQCQDVVGVLSLPIKFINWKIETLDSYGRKRPTLHRSSNVSFTINEIWHGNWLNAHTMARLVHATNKLNDLHFPWGGIHSSVYSVAWWRLTQHKQQTKSQGWTTRKQTTLQRKMRFYTALCCAAEDGMLLHFSFCVCPVWVLEDSRSWHLAFEINFQSSTVN